MLEAKKIETRPSPHLSKNALIANGTLQLQLSLIRQATENLLDQLVGLNGAEAATGPIQSLSLYDEVKRFEIQLISKALAQTYGHQRKAAHLLGMKPTTLNSKIKRYRILPSLRTLAPYAGNSEAQE